MNKDILVVLPNFYLDDEDIKNFINVTLQEFKNNKLIFLSYLNTHDYYYQKLSYLGYDFFSVLKKQKIFTTTILRKTYQNHSNFNNYILVILRNTNNEISIKIQKKSKLNVYIWSALNNRIRSIKDEIQDEEDFEINSNIFSKISKKYKSQYVLTPYGFTMRHTGYGYINEMGFRIPKNYLNLKNREENHKLICFFGNSSCFSMRVRDNELFTNLLEQKLNSYFQENSIDKKVTILNFGMMGHLVLNEIYTYIAFAQELNPDLVFAHHLINDLVAGMTNDNLLLTKFNYNYLYLFEEWSLKLHKNNIGLGKDFPARNTLNSSQDIINAYYTRDKQFKSLVENNKSKYISVIQPASFSKKKLSEREKKGIELYINKLLIDEEPFIKSMYCELIDILKDKHEYCDIIDLHTMFEKFDDKDSLFSDWIHTNANGDKVMSEFIFEHMLKHDLLQML
ncbi:MAG: hypothetical protein PHE60_03100 [Sulfurospirillaceae bacterium]|nr:hypothetical protein [Sulfurospirillaceae bacterium]